MRPLPRPSARANARPFFFAVTLAQLVTLAATFEPGAARPSVKLYLGPARAPSGAA